MRLVAEAVQVGVSQRLACRALGITERTVQRWRTSTTDKRSAARRTSPNGLSAAERKKVLAVVNSPEFRDLSPKQIVPILADRNEYLASESTIYRLLDAEGQLAHRAASRPPKARKPREHVATGPNQVWSWDITYLRAPVRGAFYYLYLVEDVWSRMIVGWQVYNRESPDLASELVHRICRERKIEGNRLVLHSDNGGPMKGYTMTATLHRLGIKASFSRPGVSDDNPFSEALFRTLKYRPNFPTRPFASLDDATTWVGGFVHWYNLEHRHSGIRFVTPHQRHTGQDLEILRRRHRLYQNARRRQPGRWSGDTRNWSPIQEVRLNPEATRSSKTKQAA